MGEVTPDAFRDTLGLFATGVTVMTTATGDTVHGMTVNAFTSVSLDPPLVLVCVARASGMHRLVTRSGCFAVTILSSAQELTSVWFASPERPGGWEQFREPGWRPAPKTGCPVLEGGLAFLDCRVTRAYEGGDHSIVLGEVLAARRLGGADPLLWFAGGYCALAPPAPG